MSRSCRCMRLSGRRMIRSHMTIWSGIRLCPDYQERLPVRPRTECDLLDMLHVANGTGLLDKEFVDYCLVDGVIIDPIEPGNANQDVFIEYFNSGLCGQEINLKLIHTLIKVRRTVSRWIRQYNEDRPHDAPDGLPAIVDARRNLESSCFLNYLFDGEFYGPAY